MLSGLLSTPSASDCKGTTGGGQGRSLRTDFHKLTSCAEAHPASQHQQQGFARVVRTPVGSGRKLSRLLKPSNPAGSCLKILLESSAWQSQYATHKWKARRCDGARQKTAMKRYLHNKKLCCSHRSSKTLKTLAINSRKLAVERPSFLLFQLHPSVLPTEEIECSFLQGMLPTPKANDSEKRGNISGDPRNGLPGQIALLCTPKGSPSGLDYARMDRRGSGGNDLVTQIAMLPTPTSRDHKSEKCGPETAERNARPLSETLGTNTGMRLQPGFVEWMQGYPVGWTEIE